MRNQTINLNLIPGGVMPVVHLSQFDQDVDGSLIFNIYNGPVPYDLTDCVAHIQGHKPDGTAFDYQCTVHETYVTAATEYQMTVVAGQYQAEMRISKDGSVVGTVNLVFSVEPSTLTNVDLSHTDIPELMTEIEQAVVATGANAEDAEESAEDSEAWSVGQRNGEDVPATDPTYHNNAKYWSGQSGHYIEDAEAWAIGERGGVPVTSGDPTYENNSKYYSEESEGSAEDSEAWAVGERNGTPVTSGDPTYQNNSEYWKNQAEGQAENAEAWAVGERAGVPVTSGDPTYENNAEYYAGEASSSATAAGTSETNAATSEGNAEAWATGQRNGSDVPATDPAYHNNSKYYSEQADDSAEDSEAWAVGERDGVPVGPSDPTYHNNAKYYSEQMGLPSLAGLTDVTLTSLADDDILEYDSGTSKWVNTRGGMTGASAGTAGGRGFVPAPAAGDQNKVLNGDGAWKALPTMTGASAGSGGTSGMVPAPSAGDQDKVLKGDGTWDNMKGGHIILNASGTTMTTEEELQFSSKVADDNVNGKTIVYSGSEEVVTVPHTSWTTQNTTIDGTVYPYKKAITLTKPIYGSPVIDRVATVGGSTTDAQITAFNCLAYVGHDPDYPTTLNLYASSVPSVDFSILVRWEGGEA